MERQSFPSQILRRWALGRDVRRRTSGSGAQAARPAAMGIRRARQRKGREDAWRRWRAPPVPWVSQRREIWMVRSARGVSRFLLLSGRSDSGIWDMAPVQAEVTNCHHCLCFNPHPGYGKDSSTGEEGRKGFGLEDSLLLPGPTGHLLTNVIPNRGSLNSPEEVSKRVPRSPSFCYRQSQGVWKPPREGDLRAGAAAPTRPRSSP